MAVTKEAKTGSKELTAREAGVLAVLGSDDLSGADMCKELTSTVGLSLRLNSLYVSLGRMEERKLVRSKRNGRSRTYKRTAPGRTALKKYLQMQERIRTLANGEG